MFHIAIADDEPFIVQLIRQLIDCETLGVEIVGDAADGLGALELVREKKPDILITDIRMPCMDGIELIEQIRENALPVSVIAISGHRRFDYAYNALKYGVEDFIVKPINKKELNDSIRKVLQRLEGADETTRQIQHLEKQVCRNNAQLREKLIDDCLRNNADWANLSSLNQAYLTHFVPGHFTGICIKLDIPQIAQQNTVIVGKCAQTIEQNLNNAVSEASIAYSERDSAFLGVINTSNDQTGQLMRKIKRLFEKLTLALDIYARISITIGIGLIVSDSMQVSDSIHAAAMCVRIKCILGAQRIYYSGEFDNENIGTTLTSAQTDALHALIESGQPEQVEPWLENVYSKPEAYYRAHPFEVLSLTASVLDSFISLCRLLNIYLNERDCALSRAEIESAASYSEYISGVSAFLQNILKEDLHQRVQRGNYPIECAKNYIAKHLSEQFKLEDVADSILLSPNYLSNLFKKETGETISDYILRLRLEKAKQLLKATNLNIGQIASSVGYTDAKHFSKLFRKMTGAKPQDYRKMYSW